MVVMDETFESLDVTTVEEREAAGGGTIIISTFRSPWVASTCMAFTECDSTSLRRIVTLLPSETGSCSCPCKFPECSANLDFHIVWWLCAISVKTLKKIAEANKKCARRKKSPVFRIALQVCCSITVLAENVFVDFLAKVKREEDEGDWGESQMDKTSSHMQPLMASGCHPSRYPDALSYMFYAPPWQTALMCGILRSCRLCPRIWHFRAAWNTVHCFGWCSDPAFNSGAELGLPSASVNVQWYQDGVVVRHSGTVVRHGLHSPHCVRSLHHWKQKSKKSPGLLLGTC